MSGRILKFSLLNRSYNKRDFIIYDRYILDHFFKGKFKRLPLFYKKLITKFYSPLLTRRTVINFLLKTTPETILQRKKEVTPTYINHYYEYMSGLDNSYDMVEIDAEKTPDEIAKKILLVYFENIDKYYRSKIK